MGLDMYWELPEGTKYPIFYPPLRLFNCFTMEDGLLTFGDYSVVLFLLSGIPMHTKYISKTSVRKITMVFNRTSYKEFIKYNPTVDCLSIGEWLDLRRMFVEYAKLGGRIRVSW